MNIKQALEAAINNQDLSTEQMISVMREVMNGETTDAQIGGFLVALRMKGESLDEIEGAAIVMRELASKVSVSGDYLVDTCGTGGVVPSYSMCPLRVHLSLQRLAAEWLNTATDLYLALLAVLMCLKQPALV